MRRELLEELADKGSTEAKLILDFRRLEKACEDIQGYVNWARNGRVFPRVNLQSLTGRITLTDPALQMVQEREKF